MNYDKHFLTHAQSPRTAQLISLYAFTLLALAPDLSRAAQSWQDIDLNTAPTAEQIQILTDHMAEIQIAAEKGDADAEIKLAALYSSPRSGVPRNYAEAIKWTRKAAEQGNLFAEMVLSSWYATGQGTHKDDDEAFKWAYKAAGSGNSKAQTALAIMYYMGVGTVKNEAVALDLFLKAANQGDATAQEMLGAMYANGYDYQASFFWLTLARQAKTSDMTGTDAIYADDKSKLSPDTIRAIEQKASEWRPVSSISHE